MVVGGLKVLIERKEREGFDKTFLKVLWGTGFAETFLKVSFFVF